MEREELMRRHRDLIALAKAKGQGQIESFLVSNKAAASPVVDKSGGNASVLEIGSKNNGLGLKEMIDADNAKNRFLFASSELTVTTAETESDKEIDAISSAIEEQDEHINTLLKVITDLEDEAQAKLMARDKVGAAAAMRKVRSQRATLVMEESLCQRLHDLEQAYCNGTDVVNSLQQVLMDGEASRLQVHDIKVPDTVLLKEIRQMIRDM